MRSAWRATSARARSCTRNRSTATCGGCCSEFGDAELGALIHPRHVRSADCNTAWPKWAGPVAAKTGRGGAAPGTTGADLREAVTEDASIPQLRRPRTGERTSPSIADGRQLDADRHRRGAPRTDLGTKTTRLARTRDRRQRKHFDPAARHKRQFDQLVAYTQKLWRDSDAARKEFWKKADCHVARSVGEVVRVVPRLLPHRGHRQAARADDAAQPADAAGLRREDLDRLRGDARRVPGRVRLRHPALAEGPEARREAAGRRLPARPRRPADRHDQRRGASASSTTTSRAGSSNSATSSTRRRTRTSARPTSGRSSARPTR